MSFVDQHSAVCGTPKIIIKKKTLGDHLIPRHTPPFDIRTSLKCLEICLISQIYPDLSMIFIHIYIYIYIQSQIYPSISYPHFISDMPRLRLTKQDHETHEVFKCAVVFVAVSIKRLWPFLGGDLSHRH